MSLRRARRFRPPKTWCLAACVGFAAWALEAPARADVSFGLSWRPSQGDACVDEAALRESVEQRLGRATFTESSNADILIEAEETPVAQGEFRARVTERDRRGNVRGVRELKAQSCPSLRRAATLIVTLIIDPHRTGRPVQDPNDASEPPASPPPEAPAPKADDVSDVPVVSPPPPLHEHRAAPPSALPEHRNRRWGVSLGAGAGTSVGILPSATVTVFALVRLEPSNSRWSFDWSGGYSLPQRLREGPVYADFAAVEQRLRSCFAVVRWPSNEVDACAGLALGAILPNTAGMQSGSDHWRLLVGPTAAVGFDARTGPLGGRVELGLTWGLRQHDFSYFDLANERQGLYSTKTFVFFVSLSGLGKFS
ncbi:hypothetical protein AKJ09_05436 [Labilithrix luteola]|uniref:Outer membrane protein beta-barrel domain-containing protein n=1 Tax=Labilithrix luteola TaxID=1391654 RepID=A0A0K1PZ60_9BACT|nr:hypothetical protein [Labilithrix luteola]AKU98772.1 hypothetical protein AKJ09_05436 [Labilithrix luteola]